MPTPRRLPPLERVIALRAQRLTYKEIGQMYGVSDDAVYQMLRRNGMTRPGARRHGDFLPWALDAKCRRHTWAQYLRALGQERRAQEGSANPPGEKILRAAKRWAGSVMAEGMVVCYDRKRGFYLSPRHELDGESLVRPHVVQDLINRATETGQ